MRQRTSRTLILAALLLTPLAIWACGGPAATPTAAPTETPPPLVPSGRCGDGICDDTERADLNLCPQDCTSTQPPPTQTAPTARPTDTAAPAPTAPPAALTPQPGASPQSGRCGDGICDEAERSDPKLCPQDCPTSEPAPAGAGAADYEPAINVFFVLHIDPSGEQGAPTFKAEPGLYQRVYNEIDWLLGEARGHGAKMTVLFNGWYTKWAVDHGDVEQFSRLVAEGHEVGTHAHSMSYDAEQDLWLQYGQEAARFGVPAYDAAMARQAWSDADQYMEAALSGAGVSDQNQTMCAWPLLCSDEGLMMDEFGFRFASGNRSEKGPFYFQHIVWNPWRPGPSDEPGHELEEDLSAGFVAVDHYAQIGAAQEAHAGVDVTPAGVKRNFLMLYAEWLSRVRRGAEDKVWTFGFVTHPNYGDSYNADISDILTWFDEYFIGKTTPQGYTIAHYATVSEIGEEYLEWEQAHPGVSSFSYVGRDPYPYTYAVMASKLDGSVYEAHVDPGAQVTCFRLSKEGQPIYLLWSDEGDRTVNLGELRGEVLAIDHTGQERVADAAALALTEEPLLVQPR